MNRSPSAGERFRSFTVIARSEATWQSPPGCSINLTGDCHVGSLEPPRNDMLCLEVRPLKMATKKSVENHGLCKLLIDIFRGAWYTNFPYCDSMPNQALFWCGHSIIVWSRCQVGNCEIPTTASSVSNTHYSSIC